MDNKEKWREIFTSVQLARLQQLQFKELQVIKMVCDQLNLQFFLYGGTLLGAYKYQGFIPWDDDIDIAMERDSYEKFIAEAPKILPKDYVLQNLYEDPKSPYSYTKFRLKGTRCIEEYNHELDIEQGIYIDIYPVDNIPDDNQQYKFQFDKIQRILAQIYIRQNYRRYIQGRKYKLLLYCFLLRLLPVKYWMSKLKSEMTKYNKIECKRKSCWHYPKSDNFYEPLFPLQLIKFEGENFLAPKDTEAHLRRRYGNIDELPPMEQRIGHYIHILDFGKFEKQDPQ